MPSMPGVLRPRKDGAASWKGERQLYEEISRIYNILCVYIYIHAYTLTYRLLKTYHVI